MRTCLLFWIPVLSLTACASSSEADEASQGFGFTTFALSAFADTDGDGLPDTRLPRLDATMVDTDGDGLPDTRPVTTDDLHALCQREIALCMERVDLCTAHLAEVDALAAAGRRDDAAMVEARLRLTDAKLALLAAERRQLELRRRDR